MTVSPISMQVTSNALQPHSLPWSYHLSQKVSDAVHSRWGMGLVALAGIVGACYSIATGVVAGLISFAIACAAQKKPSLDQLDEALSNKNFARVQYILEAHQGNPNVNKEFILTKFKSFVETIEDGSEPSRLTLFEFLLNHPALKKWKALSPETMKNLMRKAIEQKNISLGVAIWKKAGGYELKKDLFIMILEHSDLNTINAFLSSPFFEEVNKQTQHYLEIGLKILQNGLRFIQQEDLNSLDLFLKKTAPFFEEIYISELETFFTENIVTSKNPKLIEIFLSHFPKFIQFWPASFGKKAIPALLSKNSLGVISHILYPMTKFENADKPWFGSNSESKAKELYDYYKEFSNSVKKYLLSNKTGDIRLKPVKEASLNLFSWVSRSKEDQSLAPQILKDILDAIDLIHDPQWVKHLLTTWGPFFSSSHYQILMKYAFRDMIEIDLVTPVLDHLQELPVNLRTDIILNYIRIFIVGYHTPTIVKHLKEKRFLNSLQASHIYKFLEIKFQNPRIALQESILPYLIKELPDAQKSFVSNWIQEKEEEGPDEIQSAVLQDLKKFVNQPPTTTGGSAGSPALSDSKQSLSSKRFETKPQPLEQT